MKMYRFYLLMISTVLFISCADTKKEEPEVVTVDTTKSVTGDESAFQGPIEAEFKDEAMKEIFTKYIEVKTALVYTDPANAGAKSSQLKKLLEKHNADAAAITAAGNMVTSSNVEEMRRAFKIVTQAIEPMVKEAIESGTVYKQYCPMAFNNTGAYWLSESKDIYNPYFGSKMLKCGRIDAEIK
jgi:hypothetical protein